MDTFWGYHAMYDCKGCDTSAVKSVFVIESFIQRLIQNIDMEAVGPPLISYLCEGDPKEGYSFVQLISTSNITGHLMNSGEAYIDVFSCKEFDPKIAEECIKHFFIPKKIRANFIIRDAG
jgi:S-adenosylmethionine/arginine decarboxylase-like enzyme